MILAAHNTTTNAFTCVMVNDIVEEMVNTANTQYTVYTTHGDTIEKRTYGKYHKDTYYLYPIQILSKSLFWSFPFHAFLCFLFIQ